MRILKPSAEIIHEQNRMKLIERVGRLCYKSEDNITPTSYVKFVENLLKRGHHAMLEHGNVILEVDRNVYLHLRSLIKETRFGQKNDYVFDTSFLRFSCLDGKRIISGSLRAWRELFLNSMEDLSGICFLLYKEFPQVFEEPITKLYGGPENLDVNTPRFCSILSDEDLKSMFKYHTHGNEVIMKHLTHTVHFICDLLVHREFVRHRKCAFAGESTRYCNYSQDKFGNEITVIEPSEFEYGSPLYCEWEKDCRYSEEAYFRMLKLGANPDGARRVLPVSTKSELIVTCTEEEWQHIIDLRYHGITGKPHPQMVEVMSYLYPQILKESEGRLK